MALSKETLTMDNWTTFFQRVRNLTTLNPKDDNVNVLMETLQDENINESK